MIVVSNTSPLTNLASIGQFDLLRQLYAELHIADAVWEELGAKGEHWPGYDQVSAANWIHRHTVTSQSLVLALQGDLDRGESESIALALELGADLVLLDEKEGRHTAERLGLHRIGVIGILLEAKTKGLVDSLRPLLDALRQIAGFYIGDSLYDSTLTRADESKQ